MSTATVSGAGITASLPRGWEGRIRQLSPVSPLLPKTAAPSRPPSSGELTEPFVHLANFPLLRNQATFGGAALQGMGPTNAFVALVQYAPSCLGTALFAPRGLPQKLRPTMFDSNALQRTIPGQAGFQAFFTQSNRPFCLYVVLGSLAQARSVVPEVNAVLRGIHVV